MDLHLLGDFPAGGDRGGVLAQPALRGQPGTGWPGRDFALALEVLAALAPLRNDSERGLAGSALAQQLHVDRLQIEPALAALTALRWVGAMPESATSYLEEGEPRYVLLADPQTTALAPLLEVLLLRQEGAAAPSVGAQWLGAAHGWRRCCPPIGRLARL